VIGSDRLADLDARLAALGVDLDEDDEPVVPFFAASTPWDPDDHPDIVATPTATSRPLRWDDDAAADLPAPTEPTGATRDGRGAWWFQGHRARWMSDITLGDLWDFPRDDISRVLVPTELARTEPELDWCLTYDDDASVNIDGRHVAACAIPAASWAAHAKVRVDAGGAQFDVRRVLDMEGVAHLAGQPVQTIRLYHSKRSGGLPEPVAVIGRSPVWTRAQIHHWVITRDTR
jgi:predicted DNA-binding transcriptional regulator AlpA